MRGRRQWGLLGRAGGSSRVHRRPSRVRQRGDRGRKGPGRAGFTGGAGLAGRGGVAARRGRKRNRRFLYGVFPMILLLFLGSLLLDEGKAVLRRLSFFLDPLYLYAMSSHGMEDSGGNMGGADGQGEVSWYPSGTANNPLNVQLGGSVEVVYGDGYVGDLYLESEQNTLESNRRKLETLLSGFDYTYLMKNFYIVDNSTYASEELFPVEELVNLDLSFVKDGANPQILIHHTHASETFTNSRPGAEEDTVVGMGIELARILSEQYGFQVIHDKTAYDMEGGKLDRSTAYNYAKEGTEQILAEYPSIQVIIDLHRDGGKKRVTTVDGRQTAQIMFFNGLSRNMNGPIAYLYNPYLKENLAFTLQLKMAAMEQYANFAKPIYLKGYEYNLSILPRSLLIEVGTDQNTVEEAINAMEPLAFMLNEVLQ